MRGTVSDGRGYALCAPPGVRLSERAAAPACPAGRRQRTPDRSRRPRHGAYGQRHAQCRHGQFGAQGHRDGRWPVRPRGGCRHVEPGVGEQQRGSRDRREAAARVSTQGQPSRCDQACRLERIETDPGCAPVRDRGSGGQGTGQDDEPRQHRHSASDQQHAEGSGPADRAPVPARSRPQGCGGRKLDHRGAFGLRRGTEPVERDGTAGGRPRYRDLRRRRCRGGRRGHGRRDRPPPEGRAPAPLRRSPESAPGRSQVSPHDRTEAVPRNRSRSVMPPQIP